MVNELDRTTLARGILSAIQLRTLRGELRNRRNWREQAFPGFRPDSITRSIATAAAPRFATAPGDLSSLMVLFLDDLGVEGADIGDRIRAAASDPRVPSETQAALLLAAQIDDVSQLPVIAESATAGADARTSGDVDARIEAEVPSLSSALTPDTEHAGSAPEEIIPEKTAGAVRDDRTSRPPPAFDWDPPEDDSADIQSAVTLFSRCFSAYIESRLRWLHGDAWLRRGCGPYRKIWKERSARASSADPANLMGYAQLAELQQIVISQENWSAFEADFESKEWFRAEFKDVIPLRQAGVHSEQRRLYKPQQASGFKSMCLILDRFHRTTAETIEQIWSSEQLANDTPEPDETVATLLRVAKNFEALPTIELMGREQELTRLHSFWEDEFERAICVSGRGGVGKTALVYSFVNELLRRPCAANERPNPELVLSLTAKQNWLDPERLEGQVPAPSEQRFGSLSHVLEAFIELCGGDVSPESDIADLRDQALTLARDMSCLIILDNLETLPDEELDMLGEFVRRLPAPSKVILTDRERPAFSERLDLRGISTEAAVSLVKSRAESEGMHIPGSQHRAIGRVSQELNGVPLYLHFFANLLIDGHTASEALQELRGRDMLWLLQFSFDSSSARLDETARELLYYLAQIPDPATRQDLLRVIPSGEELDAAIRRLRNAHFVENVEMGTFRITDAQLREYVISQFPQRISIGATSRIQHLAGSPVQSQPNIERAIDQLISEAREFGRADWERAYEKLEDARAEFGEAPKIIAELGYFAYRLRRRDEARRLLEQAIRSGYEDANTYRNLGLVYYYEGSFDEAIRQAEASLTLRPDEPRCLLLLGDALLRKVERSTFALDSARRSDLVQAAKTAVQRSLIEDDLARWQRDHNDRRARLLDRAEEMEKALAYS